MLMSDIPVSDFIGLAWFLLLWTGYTWYADRGARRRQSLRAVMHGHRYAWMKQMLARDNRVMDVNILRNLLQGVAFFASTTLLILAGLVTVLGSTDRAISLIHGLPFASHMTLMQWELRLLVLVVIFVHAFFKLTWALRQFNYCSVLIGAAPPVADDSYALRAAEIATLAFKDFNQALRAYYFSLATLGWFVSPWVFMAAASLVMAVLYWREYHSRAMRSLNFTSPV